MNESLRIAQVGPVATSIPPRKSRSVELITSLLTEELVVRGHTVTLFATGTSRTSATLRATFKQGYNENPSMWPWELCELFNLAAAIEHAQEFDLIHYQAVYAPTSLAFSRIITTPIVQTVHYTPASEQVAIWSRYPDAPFVAISHGQAKQMSSLNVVATIHHGLNLSVFPFSAVPQDYLLYLGRFTEGKGVLQAIKIAHQSGIRLVLAGEENDYYRTAVAPHVDGKHIVYVGEADHVQKVALLGGARALLYPLQSAEPFGLVLIEAMACGTPSAALDTGAVREIVEHGVTGGVFSSIDLLIAGLPMVLSLDRSRIRATAVSRFTSERMVDAYVCAYRRVIHAHRNGGSQD
jgi:glycosyltransferase involved in cell wall biosynthesis